MKNITDNFKTDIRTYGRQFNFEIKINDTDTSEDDVNYIKPSFNSSLFKTIMHQIEIDSKNEIPLKSKIKVKAGVKVNKTNYEYVSYNTCAVKYCERQEDTNSYICLAYDKMIESMIDYDLTISEKITLRNYLIKVCERLGWNTNNIPATFINSDKLVDPRLHIGIGYTFRDVLDEIATISCSFLLFKGEDFYLIYPTETNENIDESYLDEDNITIGEKYFINSLVFSRAEESDNIYRKDDTNIQLNGLHEFKIADNQLLSTNDRDLYIDDMFNYLKTFEFYVFDVSSKGILFLEACDRFSFVLNDVIYSTILLNNEISFEDGLTEALYTDKPNETETEYKYADSTDKKINQTYILVDKQNQKIESVISNVTEQNNKISQVTQTVDELNSKISDIADITTSQESINGTVSLEKINQSEPIYVKIYPRAENISYLYPHSNLYPSETLYLKTRMLRFTNTTNNTYVDYELPDNLLYYDAGNYDEFILDYDAQSCVINKKVGYNADGTTYLLENPTTIEYEYPKIELEDGDYTVSLLGYTDAYLFVRLMAQNIYTTQFATRAEVNSEISQKANEITATVSTTYATKGELNTAKSEIKQTTNSIQAQVNNNNTDISTLKQTATNISSEVSKKVGNDEIISKVNQSAEQVQIDANKININGTVSANGNFKIDTNGNMTCNNATVTGGKIALSGGTINNPNFYIEGTSVNEFVCIAPDGISFNSNDGHGYLRYSNRGSTIGQFDVGYDNGTNCAVIQSMPQLNHINLYADDVYVVEGKMHAQAYNYDSRETLKKNIEKYNDKAIDIVKNAELYKYNYKTDKEESKKYIGFVIGDNGGKYKTPYEIISQDNGGINSYNMSSILWKAIQEQQEMIEQLQKEIQELKGEK